MRKWKPHPPLDLRMHEQRTSAGETLPVIPASHILKICKSFIWWLVFVLYGEQIKQPIAGGDYRWRFFTTWGGWSPEVIWSWKRILVHVVQCLSMLLEFKTLQYGSTYTQCNLTVIKKNKNFVTYENYCSWYVINVVFMIFLLFFSFLPPPQKKKIVFSDWSAVTPLLAKGFLTTLLPIYGE